MADAREAYWEETIAVAAEECGAVLTDDQIKAIAGAAQSSHENYGMAFYSPPPGEHLQREIKELQRKLDQANANAEETEWFWRDTVLRAKGLSPDRYWLRKEGKQVFIEERR